MNRFTDDADIWRAAQLMLDQYGDDAPLQGAQRADQLIEDGDAQGGAVWRQILGAIEELRRERREDEAIN